MNKIIRRIVFFIFFLLFIFLAPALVMYAEGYRIDFENKKITQTGGFFVKTLPKQVRIFVDDKLVKKTDFLFGSALIENLLPRRHKFRIEKEEYLPWEKVLEIKEKEVIETKNIILFPENPSLTFVDKGIKNIWFSPDKKKIIWKEEGNSTWSLKLYDLDKKLKIHLVHERDFSKNGAEISNLEIWGEEIYIETIIEEEPRDFTLQIEKIPPRLKEIEKTEEEESFLELMPSPEKVITYRKVNDNTFYYLGDSGFFYQIRTPSLEEEKITETPLAVEKDLDYKIMFFSDFIFLQEDGVLYLLDKENKSWNIIFEGLQFIKVSPDNQKLVLSSDHEIQVFFLEENNYQPKIEKGERIFLLRFSEKIRDVFWLNPYYLIFGTENEVKIAEIDNRDKINTVRIAEFENPKIFWEPNQKRVYILSQENLWMSQPLIP